MRKDNPLYPWNVDNANYLLRSGRATYDDAVEYCEAWNAVKLSTTCTAGEVECGGVIVPYIHCASVWDY